VGSQGPVSRLPALLLPCSACQLNFYFLPASIPVIDISGKGGLDGPPLGPSSSLHGLE